MLRSLLVPATLAAVIATASPAHAAAPPAHAAGGDVVTLTYPSLVTSRVTGTTRAVERALGFLDDGDVAKATSAMSTARRKMSAAWSGAKYAIKTAPPPVAEEAGDAPVGPTKAAPADIAVLVLTLHHDTVAALLDALDSGGADAVPLLGGMLRFTGAQRDAEIAALPGLIPSAPADEARAHPRARAAGGAPVAATLDTLMPNVSAQLDDELQTIDGIRADATDLDTQARNVLAANATRIERTRGVVLKTWPPVPAED